MKVYTSVTLNMGTGEVVAEKSFEYSGTVMECKGDTTVQAPQPTEQELEIQQLQLDEMRRQSSLQGQLEPFLLESLGYAKNAEGNYVKLPEPPKDEITQLLEERQLAALRGDLPVSPALEEEINDQRARIMENLSRKLGSNFEQTTPGIQSLSEFDKRAELLREEARRGQISVGEGLLESRLGFLSDLEQRSLSNISGLASPIDPASYNALLQPYISQRNNQFQADTINAQNSAARTAGLFNLGGSVLGLGGSLGAAAILASSKDFKEDIKPADDDILLEKLKGSKVYTWKYKGDDRKHVGMVTEEAPEEVVTAGGKALDVVDMLGALTASTRALAKKVDKLEGDN